MRFMNTALKKTFLLTCVRLTDGQPVLGTPERKAHHFGTIGAQAEINIRDWLAVSAFTFFGGEAIL